MATIIFTLSFEIRKVLTKFTSRYGEVLLKKTPLFYLHQIKILFCLQLIYNKLKANEIHVCELFNSTSV